jgi:hypothetical protein
MPQISIRLFEAAVTRKRGWPQTARCLAGVTNGGRSANHPHSDIRADLTYERSTGGRMADRTWQFALNEVEAGLSNDSVELNL